MTTQEGNHDGSDDQRSVIMGGVTLVLPTMNELLALHAEKGVPMGWLPNHYWSASQENPGEHWRVQFADGTTNITPDQYSASVAFQVI